MSIEKFAKTDIESLNALRIVQETMDINLLKYTLLNDGKDFTDIINALNKGVEKGPYTEKERDTALQGNEDMYCMCAIDLVKNGAPYRKWEAQLHQGVRTGLFSREEVSKAVINGVQVQYRKIMEEARKNPKPEKSNVIAWLPSYCIR